jgi:hypothetical protein
MIELTGVDLGRLNSLTKYPSIPTYHPMGEKGRLQPGAPILTEPMDITEKIDGSNARIIFGPWGYFLGSREELLHFGEDVIYNPDCGIVASLDRHANSAWYNTFQSYADAYVVVAYGELFGGKQTTKNYRQYSGFGLPGFRVFDVQTFSLEAYNEYMGWERDKIATWRDMPGSQQWLSRNDLLAWCIEFDYPVVPQLGVVAPGGVPRTIEETWGWINTLLTETQVSLDDQAGGKPEGIILRTRDRTNIYKLRFEDYARTMRAS